MTEFLKQVARHYCSAGEDVGCIVFVLPSQRSVVFFRKYLQAAMSERSGRPAMSPPLLSIDDFLTGLSPVRKAERIDLLVLLYECYSEEYRKRNEGRECESLDEFLFWGDIILADFNDVDKYEIEAKDLFTNIAQYREISDDFSHLSPTQKEAMRKFLDNFRDSGKIFKDRFSGVWDMLYPIYRNFNDKLKASGLSYEGGVYRQLLDTVKKRGAEEVFHSRFPRHDKVVFCGLNVLSTCEKGILDHFRNVSLAEFCWDYCSRWIQDEQNRSSCFLGDYVKRYPAAFDLEKCDTEPAIDVVSVPSAVGQVKFLSEILREGSVPLNERTAIVLPDETLLIPLLDSLPEEVKKINVTMGFPMKASSFYSLMNEICQLQLNCREKNGRTEFYHKQVWSIVDNNIFDAVADEKTRIQVLEMKSQLRYFVPSSQLCGSPALDCVFRHPVENGIKGLSAYLLEVLDFIGGRIAEDEQLLEQFSLEMDCAMEFSKLVTRLADKQLNVKFQTWLKLLRSLAETTSIPFKGEPLNGLQIMGPLETRALDFDRLFILSANESVFPRKSQSPSFIPHFLRAGFDMPTYEYQDAVWAYYFYRMIQRPEKVCLMLDSRTDGLKSGEESRYIKQLQYGFEANIRRIVVDAVPSRCRSEKEVVQKTDEDLAKIRTRALSATTIKEYIECPAKFYYDFVQGMKEEEEVAENLDAGLRGRVFHKVMETIYCPDSEADGYKKITDSFLTSLINNKDYIRGLVESAIKEVLKVDEIYGRNIIDCRLIQKYVETALSRDREFLQAGGSDSFKVFGVERRVWGDFCGLKLTGVIDRLDSFREDELRVVDYKTGKVLETDMQSESGIALQFFIYDYLMHNGIVYTPKRKIPGAELLKGKKIVNCVYSTRSFLSKAPVDILEDENFYKLMQEWLSSKLTELLNKEIPFKRTEDEDSKNCEYCNFKNRCGR